MVENRLTAPSISSKQLGNPIQQYQLLRLGLGTIGHQLLYQPVSFAYPPSRFLEPHKIRLVAPQRHEQLLHFFLNPLIVTINGVDPESDTLELM